MYRDDVGRGLEKEVIWQINTVGYAGQGSPNGYD